MKPGRGICPADISDENWVGQETSPVDTSLKVMYKKLHEEIEKEAKAWTATVIFILIAAMVLLFFIMLLLVRGISRSLQSEIPKGSEGEALYDDDDDDK